MANKYRCFEITSQEPYLTKDKILAALSHKSIKEYAYILHDKDTYTEKQITKILNRLGDEFDAMLSGTVDEKHIPVPALDGEDRFEYAKRLCPYNAGDLKPKHWHCYITVSPALEIKTVAKWFDTAANNVEVKMGAGAFVDCLEYAVHQTDNAKSDGKYPYDWSELISNVDAQDRVLNKQARRLKYNRDLNDSETLQMRVLNEGMTLYDAADKYPVEYAKNISLLTKLRGDYLSKKAPMPATRYNFFFTGDSGIGKDVTAKAFARRLYPDLPDDKIFHIVTDLSVPFDGYDGQPVIIWSDVRSKALCARFTRSGFYSLIDISPIKTRRNIKYGSVTLVNTFNFFTSVETYPDFLAGLAGVDISTGIKEPKTQAYRRFPFIVPIYTDYFEILFNMGWLDGKSYEAYKQLSLVRGNLARTLFDKDLRVKLNALSETDRKALADKIEGAFLDSPIKDIYQIVKDKPEVLSNGVADAVSMVDDLLKSVTVEKSDNAVIDMTKGVGPVPCNDDSIPFA